MSFLCHNPDSFSYFVISDIISGDSTSLFLEIIKLTTYAVNLNKTWKTY